ncbi:MAG: ATP-binding cassette domain-containing protein [Hespellia sp.]|nr:ATP-binding cassette domain-containing protein [Hespellia sp.]
MLVVEHLSYDVTEEGKQSEILSDVSFSVEEGEMLVITGPNGGGKSTLAKLLMGINQPTEGRILLSGQDITGLSIDERAKAGIGFAFQQPPRFKGMTVRRLLSLAAGETLSEDRCCDLLSSVGLCAQEYINREADATLSGGEMKRIEIATVLARPHQISIFDEPEAGIDLWSFSMLMKRFEQLHQEKRSSMLLISHQERIIEMADQIMIISDGKVEAKGDADEMMPRLFGEQQGDCLCKQNGGGYCNA